MDMRKGSPSAVYQFSGEAGKRGRRRNDIRARRRRRKRRRLYKWIALAAVGIGGLVVAGIAYGMNSSSAETPKVMDAVNSGQTDKPIQERQIVQPTEEYQTAIASMDWDADESEMLARIAMAEAEGEDVEGKALVILVVLNRVWSDKFPDSIEEVITQERQFTAYENGRYDRLKPDEGCWDALELVMYDRWDESQGALYFESESKSTWHQDNLKRLFRHGNHIFYTDKE